MWPVLKGAIQRGMERRGLAIPVEKFPFWLADQAPEREDDGRNVVGLLERVRATAIPVIINAVVPSVDEMLSGKKTVRPFMGEKLRHTALQVSNIHTFCDVDVVKSSCSEGEKTVGYSQIAWTPERALASVGPVTIASVISSSRASSMT